MAETSDYTGFVPAGTPHYSGFQSPSMTHLGSSGSFGSFDEGRGLLALVIFYGLAYLTGPGQFLPSTGSWSQLMPDNPIQESAVTPYSGRGMWIGPGVEFYAV